MNAFFDGLGRFTVKFRWLIVVVWLVGTFASVHYLPSLASQVNNDNSAFLPPSAPSTIAGNLAEPLIGKSTLVPVIIVAVRNDGTITPADAQALVRLAAAAKKVTNVARVQYVGTSKDGHAVQLLAEANIAGFSPGPSLDVVNGLTAAFAKADAPAGLQFHLAGTVATNVANQQQSKAAGNKTQLATIVFIIVLLLFVFRSVLAPLVTLLPAAIVLQVSGAFIGELGSHGLKISQVTQLLLIVLILGAGTDYGLFLVFRVREGVRSGMSPNDAVARAVSRVGESISASAGTVILALLTLLFASFGIYHDLGVPLAIGIAVMLVAGLTLLPALLSILGRAVFWPSKIVAGELHESWWGRVAQRVVARPALDALDRPRRVRRARAGVVLLRAGGLRRGPDGTERHRRRGWQRRPREVLPAGERESHEPHPSTRGPGLEGHRGRRLGGTSAPDHRAVRRAVRPAQPRRRAHPAGHLRAPASDAREPGAAAGGAYARFARRGGYRRRCMTLIA